jgi:hypothetical protein
MSALAADEIVYSGPQVGEKVVPFKVLGVYDEYKGRELDLVGMADGKPFMLVFVHNSTRPAADLTRALLHYADTRADSGLFSALVFLTDDVTAAERHMREANGWWHNGPPAGICLDGAEGPGTYGLNRNVTMTVLIGTHSRVTANFALVQPSDSDAARILPSVTRMVGGNVPSLPEVEFLRSPTRLPEIKRQWEYGKAPTDPKLRSLICNLLRDSEDAQKVAKTAAEIDARVAANSELQGELGETARLVLTRNYGSRPPIIKHVPKLAALFTEWDKRYFAPDILAEE